MGSGESTPSPPPSPLFGEPWRDIDWSSSRARDLQYVRDYQTNHNDFKHLRFLLYGPVGAGKSTFINTVSSTVRERMVNAADVNAGQAVHSHTKKYQTHKIRIQGRSGREYYPFVFNDIMGLEDGKDVGVRAEDIKLAMKGHMRDGYKFNPMSSLTEDDSKYNPLPSPDDKVHVLVCVLNADVAQLTESVLQKMANIREVACDLGIPQMAIITNVDGACGETGRYLRNIYRSKHLKKKMKDFSATVGIPLNNIFPVKNYSHEHEPTNDVDTLVLSALRRMIDFGDDFIDTN